MEHIIELDNTSERLEAFEKELAVFAKDIRGELQRKLLSLGMHDRLKISKSLSKLRKVKKSDGSTLLLEEQVLIDSLRSRLNRRGGEVRGPSWSFARHGIFLERGIGKGRPVGSAAAAAAAKPWISPILDAAVEELADIVAEGYADILAGQMRILIPGVIDKTVITK